MATILQDPSGTFPTGPAPSPSSLQGLMSLSDWAALAQAPQVPVGTEVSVRAKPIGPDLEAPLRGRKDSGTF
jgi:hypothetical protein